MGNCRLQSILAILAILLLLCAIGYGQSLPELRWTSINHRDGIPEFFVPHEVIRDRLGRIWIAHEQGLIRYDGNRVEHIFNRQENSEIQFSAVQGLYEDPNGFVWITIRSKGVAVIDPVTDQIIRIFDVSGEMNLASMRLWNFFPDKGKLWIGSESGLVSMTTLDSTFQNFQVAFPEVGVERLAFYNVMRDIVRHPFDSGKLLIGAGGLLEFDKSSGEFQTIKMPFDAEKEVGLKHPEYLIMDIEVPDASSIWCATWAGGTMVYNYGTKQWTRIRNVDHNDPLWQDVGFQLKKRNDNEAWYAGRDGFGCVNLKSGTYRYYKHSPTDIHSIHPGPVRRFLFTQDSLLIVVGDQGISIADNYPGYRPNKAGRKPFLTELRVNDKSWQGDTTILFLHQLTLQEDENSLAFSVGLPDFYEKGKTAFRVMLDGYDRVWNEIDGSQIRYPNLDPGKYKFKYQSSQDGRYWVDGVTSPTIYIKGSLWKNPLFLIVVILFLAGFGFVAFSIRVNQIKKEEALTSAFNKRLAIVEMSALRAQMNPHFLFNSLNAINTYILKEKTKEASTYLTKFSQLMRSVLHNSKSALVPWSEELKALRLYIELEAVRFQNDFQYSIEVDSGIDLDGIWVPPLLIQPYAENAIRHGLLEKEDGPGVLTIRIMQGSEDTLEVHVQDNGIGRKQAEVKKRLTDRNRSYGMEITNDRIKLLEQTLGIKANISIQDLYSPEGKAMGTTIILIMPILRSGDVNGKKQKS